MNESDSFYLVDSNNYSLVDWNDCVVAQDNCFWLMQLVDLINLMDLVDLVCLDLV